MELLGRYRLTAFAKAFPKCREPFKVFACEVEDATWKGSGEIKARYRSTQIGKNGRVVFGFLDDLYLVQTQIRFDKGLLLVERTWAKTAKADSKSALN